MRLSILIPVGDLDEWCVCEKTIKDSISAYQGGVEAEVVPCMDLEHKGAYMARNEGLKRATGDWIAWVDCDDTVEREWFGEIAQAIELHTDCEVIQFEATEIKDGNERHLGYFRVGELTGEDFARELLRGDGMPAWLWTRAFKREIFEGMVFAGRVKQDYRMFLSILPKVHKVWSIGKPLYRYHRHGHGLSNYIQAMDYRAAGEDWLRLIEALPEAWQRDAVLGLALTMADVAWHTKGKCGARYWVRRYLWRVLIDLHIPLRLKLKCGLGAITA